MTDAKPSRRARKSPRAKSIASPIAISSAIRWSKVMTAQARIAVGYYEREDVKEMVLDAVLKELKRH